MSSCVSYEEQNELVVRTGMEFRLRRLNLEKLKGRGIFVICPDKKGVFNKGNQWNLKYIEQFQKDCGGASYLGFTDSFLDIPKADRSKEVIICYDEPSYSGRQSLYHIFGGEKLGLKTYQIFVDVMEKTQANGDAIVFTAEEVMWFPGPKPEFPAEEIYKFANIAFTLDVPLMSIYKVNDIPESVQIWVLKSYPQTKYVNIQMVDGKDHEYHIWGWNEAPVGSSGSQKADWWQYIKGIKKPHVVISSIVDLKKQADEFNKKYSTSLQEQLVIVCDPAVKYFSDWVNMAEKLIKRLEKEKFYPSILIPGVGNIQQRLSYSYASRKWNFDIDQEWNSSSVFAWLMERRKEAGISMLKPETFQETTKIQEEPDLKAQVTTLTDAIKTLTEVVAKLAAKS